METVEIDHQFIQHKPKQPPEPEVRLKLKQQLKHKLPLRPKQQQSPFLQSKFRLRLETKLRLKTKQRRLRPLKTSMDHQGSHLNF